MNLGQAYGADGRPLDGAALERSCIADIADACSHWRTLPSLANDVVEACGSSPHQVVDGSVPQKITEALRVAGRTLSLREIRSALPCTNVHTIKQALARLVYRRLVLPEGTRRHKRYGLPL